jgi:nucleoside-diphosphate-sugar epimerase
VSEANIIDTQSPVLVTGATGYVAGWVVKRLLEAGCTVHAAVRDPGDAKKLSHLKALDEVTPGSLRFFAADLLQDGSYADAIQGCAIVFHTASPFVLNPKDAQRDLIDPAKLGTTNVLQQAAKTPTVRRVLLTSSYMATIGDNADMKSSGKAAVTEEDWNTTSSPIHQPYAYSKTVAERTAWEIAESQSQWQLITINPAFVMGPGVSPHATSESFQFIKDITGGKFASGIPNFCMAFVDVREVAAAHLNAAFLPGAHGRYLISAVNASLPHMADLLKQEFGGQGFSLPKRTVPKALAWLIGPVLDGTLTRKAVARNVNHPLILDNSKSHRELGLSYRPLTETMRDMVQQLLDAGVITGRSSSRSVR